MAVTLRANFTAASVKKDLQEFSKQVETAVVNGLVKVGEKFIENARNKGTYKDRTGNLRASLGYVILKNGVQLKGSVPPKAQAAIRAASAKHPRGYVLIGVAGMKYAAAVEAKQRDVISASVLIAGEDLKTVLMQINRKLAA